MSQRHLVKVQNRLSDKALPLLGANVVSPWLMDGRGPDCCPAMEAAMHKENVAPIEQLPLPGPDRDLCVFVFMSQS